MVAGAWCGGWIRVDNEMHYYWPFIATDFDSKQLDGTTGVHRSGQCVYGMLWMDKPVGPESDHLSPWVQGPSSLTKYRCINCHTVKTVYEAARAADKRAGIARSPTAPVQQKDTSTTYDVDYSGRGSRGQTKLSFVSVG